MVLRRACQALIVLVTALLVGAASSLAGEPVRRDILALYDSAVVAEIEETEIHLIVEMPLNHLGFVVRYHDLQTGLPSDEDLIDVVAILTMFQKPVPNYSAYFRWLGKIASNSGPRVIIIGDVGGPVTPITARWINPVFERIGLKLRIGDIPEGGGSTLVTLDSSVMGFERDPDPVPESHPFVARNGDIADVALEYETNTLDGQKRSVVVATGPGGGFAATGFYIFYDPALDIQRWILDPFTFFSRALGEPFFPVPDTTTVSGRRLFFSHVDGDGWNSLTRIERYRDRPTTAAEVMLKELVGPYPDLPVTIGPVLTDIDPQTKRGAKAIETARALFALPQVEVATHTNTHPFKWGFFEDYDRGRELELIQRSSSERPQSVLAQLGQFVASARARPRNPFIAMSDDLPRAFLRDEFSVESEVGRALRETERLAPDGKKIAVYLWSGDALPFEAAIGATRDAGVRNLNGGSTRFDNQRPSVSYISPVSRPAGSQRQIYAVNTNENVYTDLWRDRFNGYAQLSETFQRTEEPKRLRGANVYYHAYSAERSAALEAIKSLLNWAREAPVVPIRASRYGAIADGFFSTQIETVGLNRWSVTNRDGLNTVRFDAADGLDIDGAASGGVLGAIRQNGSLYVALDEAVKTAIVALRRDAGSQDRGGFAEVMLQESRWLVSGLERSDCGFSFRSEGYGRGDFIWSGLPARSYRLTALREGEPVYSTVLHADDTGELAFTLPLDGIQSVGVELSCDGEGGQT